MDDNLVEAKISMNDRLNKLEARIKYLVLEAGLDCECIRCLRLSDQFDKFKTELSEAYPWLDRDPVPPRPPKDELLVYPPLPSFPPKPPVGMPSNHVPAKHF
jgi:hypothetical protein